MKPVVTISEYRNNDGVFFTVVLGLEREGQYREMSIHQWKGVNHSDILIEWTKAHAYANELANVLGSKLFDRTEWPAEPSRNS